VTGRRSNRLSYIPTERRGNMASLFR